AAAGRGARRARRSGRRGVASPVLAFEVAPIVGRTAPCALEGAAKPGQDRRRLLARLRPRPREQVQVLLDQAGDRRSPPGGVALGLRHHFLVHAQGELAHIRIVSLSSYVFNSWARETSTTGGSRGDPLLHPPPATADLLDRRRLALRVVARVGVDRLDR